MVAKYGLYSAILGVPTSILSFWDPWLENMEANQPGSTTGRLMASPGRLMGTHSINSPNVDHMNEIGLSRTAECSCRTDRQTLIHIILNCQEIECASIKNKIRLQNWTLTIKDILAPDHSNQNNLER